MKKLSFFLALITVATICLAACTADNQSSDSSTTTKASTSAQTTTTTTVTTETTTSATTAGDNGNDPVADPDAITVNGDLSDWGENAKTLNITGVNDETSHKSATFYAKLTDKGLYLACDAYHDIYSSGQNDWWTNSNFEFFINPGRDNQCFVYASGLEEDGLKNDKITEAKMKTEALTGDGAKYHTVTEAFIALDSLPAGAVVDGTIKVGVAWKTVGDINTGGEAAGGGNDEYWVPKGTWPDNNDQAIVTADGIYTRAEYEALSA